MAGYSGTPLATKLGIKPGARVCLLAAPAGFEVGGMPDEAEVRTSLRGTRPLDVVVLFCPDAATLRRRFDAAAARLSTSGGLWIAWPKKASGVATDLDDAAVRAFGLAAGLVDNKVCAVDEVWSGLRFVRRLRDR
ncbi:MAG: DUF3052 domain-containing protein [Planctomycetota bacterium]